MIDGRSVLCVVPARGGSKGVPRKNLQPVGGRPLLDWTIRAARDASVSDRVIVSTDDPEIAAAARSSGAEVPFLRPGELATDEAATIDVVLHALDAMPPHDIVIVLQPTSPLRTAADIDAACRRMLALRASSCVSVCEADQSPYWMYRLAGDERLEPLLPPPGPVTRRQDLPAAFVLNGAVYVSTVDALRESRAFVRAGTVAHVMPASRSLDIDTEADFAELRRIIGGASGALGDDAR